MFSHSIPIIPRGSFQVACEKIWGSFRVVFTSILGTVWGRGSFRVVYKPGSDAEHFMSRIYSSSLRPGTKAFTCGKWIIGYNFGKDDGAESKLAHLSINIVLVSHLLCHVTILLKIVDYWSIGGRFKKRNRGKKFSNSYWIFLALHVWNDRPLHLNKKLWGKTSF